MNSAARPYRNADREPLEIGDIVRPVSHGEGRDFVGVVTFVMPDVVANPYSVEWSNGRTGMGLERAQLVLLMRPQQRTAQAKNAKENP